MRLLPLFRNLATDVIMTTARLGSHVLPVPRHDVRADPGRIPAPHDEAELEALVDGLLARMTPQEQLEQLSGDSELPRFALRYTLHMLGGRGAPRAYSGHNERLGIPPLSFADGPRGVGVGTGRTCFPATIARGATWDRALETRVGEAMARELRAIGANYSAAVCVNVLRHPGWGRAQETYGEDPYLLAELGIALTEGLQRHNVMACVKHFALNSIECARFYVDVQVSERALREVYLAPFRAVVQRGRAASVMSAYNKVRGEYCGHSRLLLTSILREQWGFDGFVSSDWVHGVRDGVAGLRAGLAVAAPRCGEPSSAESSTPPWWSARPVACCGPGCASPPPPIPSPTPRPASRARSTRPWPARSPRPARCWSATTGPCLYPPSCAGSR